ncbi:hypothetical protein [Lutibacter citreus]|uniref:hypothetical protein n=1 Tax=Lutibacter citreus TaxID=2138210 RepID=UPI000DBE1E29|nr:hypothetical protein [Lutibacter citreus]
MKGYKFLIYCLLFFLISIELNAQNSEKSKTYESITLAQAYINLSLTETYFDSLSIGRISKILPYEERELRIIKDRKFIRKNLNLYKFTHALLYFNKAKLLYIKRNDTTREELKEWVRTLKNAHKNYNGSIKKQTIFTRIDSSWYELINFNNNSKVHLSKEITNLSIQFTPYLNNDIYPDFKKLFNDAKYSNRYNFLKLWGLAANYNLSLEFSILNSLNFKLFSYLKPFSGNIIYELDLKHDLISRYIQLKYIASNHHSKSLSGYQINNLYDLYNRFIKDLKKEKDEFILKELNPKVCESLYKELNNKYPNVILKSILTEIKDGSSLSNEIVMPIISQNQYFFPNPAPLPSTSLTIMDFQPSITTLGQVDDYMSEILDTAGYTDQLHYYYDLDGFAMTTSLEKFNTNGTSVDDNERWIKNLGSDGKFSYYEIFKSLFFEMESEFRMFALIVASKNVTISDAPLSAGMAEQLMQNSYNSLPDDLKNREFSNKNLSVLVYHFHQSDIGEVPMLNISSSIEAREHLGLAGLDNLIKN